MSARRASSCSPVTLARRRSPLSAVTASMRLKRCNRRSLRVIRGGNRQNPKLNAHRARGRPWTTTVSSSPRSNAFTPRAGIACSSISCEQGQLSERPVLRRQWSQADQGLVLERLSRHGPAPRRRSRRWRRRCTTSAPARAARATSAATPIITSSWKPNWRPSRQGRGAALHLGLCLERGGAVDAWASCSLAA